MKLNTYADVRKLLNDVLSQNISTQTNQPEISDVPTSPHGAFWDLPYEDFVNGNVPGISDPKTGQPMKILLKGNSSQSNLILALLGANGSLFDPISGAFGQMPANGPPMLALEQIRLLADWIDAGCPQ